MTRGRVVDGEDEPAEERLPVGLLAGPANPTPQHEKMPEVKDPASRTKLQWVKQKLSSILLFYSAFRTWKDSDLVTLWIGPLFFLFWRNFLNIDIEYCVLYDVGESGVGASSSGGGDSVAMGTWRADAQHSGTSGADDSFWNQDSYESQWS